MIKIDGDDVVFSTGKRKYCNRGGFSLDGSYDGKSLYIGYGSDGGISVDELTEQEIDELVDMVIQDANCFRVNAKIHIEKINKEKNISGVGE